MTAAAAAMSSDGEDDYEEEGGSSSSRAHPTLRHDREDNMARHHHRHHHHPMRQHIPEDQQHITLRLHRPAHDNDRLWFIAYICRHFHLGSITFGKYKKATASSSASLSTPLPPSATAPSHTHPTHANASFIDLSNDANDAALANPSDYADSDDMPNDPSTNATDTPLQTLVRSLRILNPTSELLPMITSLHATLNNAPNRRQTPPTQPPWLRQRPRRRLRTRQTNAQHRRDNRRHGFIMTGNNIPADIDSDIDAIWRTSSNNNNNNNNNNTNNNNAASSDSDTDAMDPMDYLIPPITIHNARWPTRSSSPPSTSRHATSPSAPSTTTSPRSPPPSEHTCGLREFRVYGGPTRDNMPLLLYDGLHNDTMPETFRLRYRIRIGRDSIEGEEAAASDAAYLLPCQYIRIEPVAAWGPGANLGVWYVELHGMDEPAYIESIEHTYKQACEEEATRICLRYLQKRGYKQSFDVLMAEATLSLGEPDFSEFHEAMVLRGEWQRAEDIIEALLATQAPKQLPVTYYAEWTCLYEDQSDKKLPCARGGHQMCIDAKRRLIYLFGGWNGTENLDDLWYYNMDTGDWTLIHRHTFDYNGPPPSSCHQMSYDTVSEELYVFGRFIERKPPITESDARPVLYAFNTRAGLWRRVQKDTQAVGGPPLLYDHQMIIDSEARVLYVSGGRAIRPAHTSKAPVYAGLYAYDMEHDQWQILCNDVPMDETQQGDAFTARSAHSMMLDAREKMLYLFCGQKHGAPLIHSMQVYDIERRSVIDLSGCLSKSPWPMDNAAQRSTIDVDAGLIHFITGLTWDRRDPGIRGQVTKGGIQTSGCDQCQSHQQQQQQQRHLGGSCASSGGGQYDLDFPYNEVWVFDVVTGKWTPVQVVTSAGSTSVTTPVARYAFQTVYDPVDKVGMSGAWSVDSISSCTPQMLYMFGGNPKDNQDDTRRLNDLWRVRIYSYIEMCRQGDKAKALNYLQTKVYAATNHMLPSSEQSYRTLAALLFQPSTTSASSVHNVTGKYASHIYACTYAHRWHRVDVPRVIQERSRVYEMILQLLAGPRSTPNDDLTHLVPLC
ncbi:Muskelin N-terminus-domain-containing protein [Syncephalis pseudoplumigaleata]|uniref:Muskelin N-terminus-domain-containing protein n=1 Tax=Syncephalis pseudoplumigaleata TaxID=1712513 RepID=A0A4P9Z112_9FUNG|nr:Muskelin N-terminus-domain-containing protein [Syncephalis pseudoplumigaleata]|eukprot:RKP25975.1 Muskelin N-terminus-domain-containing protein [Syncephalis pseudoplumigaleata]